MNWVARVAASAAIRKVVYLAIAALVAFLVGTVDAQAATEGRGFPVEQGLAVPCTGPDEPPGCDPEETPAPTPTPTPTPTPAWMCPEPPCQFALADEDRDRLDWLRVVLFIFCSLVVVLLVANTVAVSFRR